MSLNSLTSSERVHIAFFGCRNAGKSSVVNAVTNQNLSVVSDIKGTTTDPVRKAMEILPIGPVVIIDTAGFDDEGVLGDLRITKTNEILGKADIAVLVVDSNIGLSDKDFELISMFKTRDLKYLIVYNKSDLLSTKDDDKFYISAKTGDGIDELRDKLGHLANDNKVEKYIIKDKLVSGDKVVLVIPVDESAPKGRIILPQQNVLREILDSHATAICCQVDELSSVLKEIVPKLVITDSQAFETVKNIVPENILLTSFSILMARYKGSIKQQILGAKKISKLKDGDKILISEGCTHHRQCNDIGTVKFPNWIKNFTGKNLKFEFSSGGEFPTDLTKYELIIHCGACMLNEAEMKTRIKRAVEQKVNIVNYGIAIAYMNGILKRSLEFFPELGDLLNE